MSDRVALIAASAGVPPEYFQKNPRAHKNKIGTSPPPTQNPKYPPPPKRGILWKKCVFSCRKNAFFPGVHKIGAANSGPRIADKNFTDTRIFLTFAAAKRQALGRALHKTLAARAVRQGEISRTKVCRMKNAMKLGICSCKTSRENWRQICREKFWAFSSFVS